MDSLHHTILTRILAHCKPDECERFGTLNRCFLQASRAPALWRKWCKQDFLIDSATPKGSTGHEFQEWRDCYIDWRKLFSGRSLKRCQVAVRFWHDIKIWAAKHFPILLQTLNSGLTQQEISGYEKWFGFRVPDELAALYLLHNGQHDHRPGSGFTSRDIDDPPFQTHMTSMSLNPYVVPLDFAGLFGHVLVYDHCACSFLLPLGSAMKTSAPFRGPHVAADVAFPPTADGPHAALPTLVLTTDRCPPNSKWAGLLTIVTSPPPFHPQDTAVLCNSENVYRMASGQLVPAVLEDEDIEGTEESQIAQWLRTYADRLSSAVYMAGPVQQTYRPDSDPGCVSDNSSKLCSISGISVFPRGDTLAKCVTRGVVVTVSSVLIPELSQAIASSEFNFWFAYQFTFSHINTSGEGDLGDNVMQAQLLSRQFKLSSRSPNQRVGGRGVIGLYPVVYPGCPDVQYQSCNNAPNLGESMSGHFMFTTNVGGTHMQSTDPRHNPDIFAVECPTFTFDHPGCMY